MPSALVSLAQLNFASGMWRGVARHLIPEDGAYDLVNLLLDELGSPYRRGGSEYLSTSAFGTRLSPFLWAGNLTPGARTVMANPNDFGVLDGSEGPVNLGLAGLSAPSRAVELAGLLFIGGGTIYGGSRKTASYSTGTVAVTNGSKTVTGTGTAWAANADPGMLFGRSGERWYVVATVDSDTQVTLRDAYEGSTAGGSGYSLSNIATATSPYRSSSLYAVAANRLFSLEGDTAYFTPVGSPHSFNTPEEFHRLPEGAQSLGAHELGDELLWFATSGLHVLSGLRLDLTDDFGNVQHTRKLFSDSLILWGHEGIATWAGSLVAPCVDEVWLVDGVSAPQRLSESIGALYRSYVQAGYKTGSAAVFRSHYFLPILDQTNNVKDVLVCRLDRPSRGPTGTTWPWSHLAGFSGLVPAFAVRTGSGSGVRNPLLLGASQSASARVLRCNSFFGPDVTKDSEPDGSVHGWTLETRDYATGDGRSKNTVRRVKVRYEMTGGTFDGSWSIGPKDVSGVARWDVALWDVDVWPDVDALEWTEFDGAAPADESGIQPQSWHLNKYVRFVRFRFRGSSASDRMVLRTVEMLVRPTNNPVGR